MMLVICTWVNYSLECIIRVMRSLIDCSSGGDLLRRGRGKAEEKQLHLQLVVAEAISQRKA
jgi:hypothetical protein